MKKEFIEHRTAFLYVPGLLLALLFAALFVASWRSGEKFGHVQAMTWDQAQTGLDVFNMFNAGVMILWLGYLVLMLFFYFAASFSDDRKNNALLFWKSMPLSDLEIMGTKALAGLSVFPAIILGWALVSAILGYVAVAIISAANPLVASFNTGADLWTFLNLELSAIAFIAITLLWYLPLFAFVGLLGTLVRNWAVPAFILILVVISSLESIITFTSQGVFARFLDERFNAPLQILGDIVHGAGRAAMPDIADMVAVGNFVPRFLGQIDWVGMVGGWLAAALFIYLASEYRRRRLGV